MLQTSVKTASCSVYAHAVRRSWLGRLMLGGLSLSVSAEPIVVLEYRI